MSHTIIRRVLVAVAITASAFAAPVTYGVSTAQFIQSGLNGSVHTAEDFHYDGTTGTSNLTFDNITVFGSANLATGVLRAQNSGSVPGGYGGINASAYASFIDTINALGSIGGLNLGVSLTIDGSSLSSLPLTNETYLRVQIFAPGHLQAAIDGLIDYYDPAYQLWGTAFALGTQSNPIPDLSAYGVTVAGHYLNGTVIVPLDIPYAAIGSNFEIQISLTSYQQGSAGVAQSWNSDYSHTIDVALAGGSGVTLQSDSGLLPGTVSSVPEPGSLLLLSAGGLLLLVRWRR